MLYKIRDQLEGFWFDYKHIFLTWVLTIIVFVFIIIPLLIGLGVYVKFLWSIVS